jgi:LmbE family N-acetylglucosaminyl deacetylase
MRPGILAVFAHPDDEQLVAGTLRQCAERGLRTGIVCATRGEAGEISDPALATPDNLGTVREEEMRAAAAVIGVEALFFLDYRDSGMQGTPPNSHRQALINADPDEATGQLVRIFRAFQPLVVVTFGQAGAYGHPDHLAMHRLVIAAFHASGDAARFPEAGPAFAPRRLYFSDVPRASMALMVEGLRSHGVDSPFAVLDPALLGMADDQVTCAVDVSDYVAMKRESLDQHRTQTPPEKTFWMLPPEVWASIRRKEIFHLAAGDPLPPDEQHCDLFAGLI